jgi:uncharacterized iron-regulated membrane protein
MGRRLRSVLFWGHLAVGVAAGVFILNMAASGLLIAYEKQITAFAERGQRTVAAPPGDAADAARLDLPTLVAKARAARPAARLSGITLSADPAAAARLNVGRESYLYVNPYTGEVLGEGKPAVRRFFQWVTSWHRWLALEGPRREIGKAVTGAAAVAYFILLLSGLYLWLPKQWSKSRLKQALTPRLTLKGKARDWNWHTTVGFWAAPLLLCTTLTGITMSYEWANGLLFRLAGAPAPEHRREGGPREGGRGGMGEPDLAGIESLWAQAERQVPGWQAITLRFPASATAPVTFMIEQGQSGRPDQMAQLTLDPATGEIVRWQPYAAQNGGQKLRAWVRPLHTGEAGGWIGQTIVVLGALGGLVLVWTGLAMACRRFFGKKSPAFS